MASRLKLCETLDGITYRSVESDQGSDADDVLEMHYQLFYRDEPSRLSTGCPSRLERTSVREATIRGWLKEACSVIAVDSSSGDRPVGFFACAKVHRDSLQPCPSLSDLLSRISPMDAHIVNASLSILSPQFVFSRFPDAKCILSMNTVSVHEDYRRRGIASVLFAKAMQLGSMSGCDLAKTTTTSAYSTKLAESLGFEKVSELLWKDYVVDDAGTRPFKDSEFPGIIGFVKRI